MIGTLHIVLAMKPLEGNFVQNALKHGVAGLNIDGSRISANGDKLNGGRVSTKTEGCDRPWKHDVGAVEACRKRGDEAVAKAESLGRGPSNVLLGHLSGCKKVGVKKVSGTATSNGDAEIGEESNGVVKSLRRGKFINRTIDGKETIEAWECQEGCPVKAMDEQSGNTSSTRSSGNKNNPKRGGNTQPAWGMSDGRETVDYRDSGGASRFFKQIKG
jgi:hypothetical protein